MAKKMTERQKAAAKYKRALKTLRDFGFVGMQLYHGGPQRMTKSGGALYMEDIVGAAYDIGLESGFNISFKTARVDVKKKEEK